MRDLTTEELGHVYGAGGKGCDPQPCHGKDKKRHNNCGSSSRGKSRSKSKNKCYSRPKKC